MDSIYLAPLEKASSIHNKSPYGNMWEKMSYHELVNIAAYKARRAGLLDVDNPKIEDDILDALNFLVFAWQKLKTTNKEKEDDN